MQSFSKPRARSARRASVTLVAPDLTPAILVVDDEVQIHSSLRLRLESAYQLVCVSSPADALERIHSQQFDLCIVDVHMPRMDGLTFVEVAREVDPGLGCVILSGFESAENLRRAVPLHVLAFIAKPIPEKSAFEALIPGWISQTRARRRELDQARNASTLIHDLELARIEKDVEATASASAREALMQSAELLTTIHALLFSAQHLLESTARSDPRLVSLARSISEARKHAESAAATAEGYFTSAYADRDSSPALVDECMNHAIGISQRSAKAEIRQQRIDFRPLGRQLALADLAGMDFVMMLVPILVQALELAGPATTVQVQCSEVPRLDSVFEDPRMRRYLWVNRNHALGSSPGVLISVRANARSLEADAARSWLRGDSRGDLRQPCRGLIRGVQLAKGSAGVGIQPDADRFVFAIGLRV